MEQTAIIQEYRGWILFFFSALILAEISWSWRWRKHVYDWREVLINVFILIGFFFSKVLLTGYQLGVMSVAKSIAFFSWKDNWLTFILGFLLVDFVYYWYHRWSHIWEPLWAFHSIHHSSKHINLTAGYRLNWLSGLITPFFFLPLVIIGFSPQLIAVSFTLNLLYQFFLHTEAVGKLGSLEGVLDTPSAHRVHHGTNLNYLDKNFGGVLMIWDRLFGTYQVEQEPAIYGEINGVESHNPFRLLFYPLLIFFRKIKFQGKTFLVILIAMFAFSIVVFGQFSIREWEKATPVERAEKLTLVMQQELHLDSVQARRIYSVNEQYAFLFDTLWRSEEKRMIKRKKAEALQESREKRFEIVLSEEQMILYRKRKEKLLDQMKGTHVYGIAE